MGTDQKHTVTVRELNQNTSAILVRVQAGEELVITSSGDPIARLVPLSAEEIHLDRLVRDGSAIPATDHTPFTMPPVIGDPAVDTVGFIMTDRYEEDDL